MTGKCPSAVFTLITWEFADKRDAYRQDLLYIQKCANVFTAGNRKKWEKNAKSYRINSRYGGIFIISNISNL